MNLPKSRKKRRVPTSTPERISIFRKWVKEHTLQIIIGFFIILAILLVLCLAYQRWILGLRDWDDWTGFAEYTGNIPKDDRGKTLWDWMELLIVPVVLAVGALLFNKAERDNDRKIANERIESELNIASERQKEAALQSYIDRLTALLLLEDGGLRLSKPNDEIRVVARTRTLATLRMLDGLRKGMLIKFLYESLLLSVDDPIINLMGADLSFAILSKSNLIKINLEGAILEKADLSDSFLDSANLNMAVLASANCENVNMSEAKLDGANLGWANLNKANLRNISFRESDLEM